VNRSREEENRGLQRGKRKKAILRPCEKRSPKEKDQHPHVALWKKKMFSGGASRGEREVFSQASKVIQERRSRSKVRRAEKNDGVSHRQAETSRKE